jgi:predicted nucleotidyltransferase
MNEVNFGQNLAKTVERFTEPDLQLFRDLIRDLQALYQGRMIAVKLVGSRARGTAKPTSDYDFLVFLDKCDYAIEVPALEKVGDQLTANSGLGPLSISPMTWQQFLGLDAKFEGITANFRRDAVNLWLEKKS